MAKPAKKRCNKEGETVVGEDAHGIDILDVPEFGGGNARDWKACTECGCLVLHECNGKQYYHKLECSESNGIGYDEERLAYNVRYPHHTACDCMSCSPPKEKK